MFECTLSYRAVFVQIVSQKKSVPTITHDSTKFNEIANKKRLNHHDFKRKNHDKSKKAALADIAKHCFLFIICPVYIMHFY